ncbi:NPAL2 protein, partial [Polypterus senegalus]
MGIGELGNFAAYGFAPAMLVAPLGCVSVIASAIISVVFLRETLRASDILGGALAISGTYLLVTFAPNVSQQITAYKVQRYCVSWQFLIYLIIEIIVFCILMYLYKKKNVKHIVVVLLIVALLASVTVISVKAVSGMITESVNGSMQLIYPIFYVMVVVMIASCAFQVKFLNQAMRLFNATEVVPINFVFFTASAIFAGVVFYQEFQGVAFLNIFMFLFGCLLSFLGVFLIAKNREEKTSEVPFIDIGQIPGIAGRVSRPTPPKPPDGAIPATWKGPEFQQGIMELGVFHHNLAGYHGEDWRTLQEGPGTYTFLTARKSFTITETEEMIHFQAEEKEKFLPEPQVLDNHMDRELRSTSGSRTIKDCGTSQTDELSGEAGWLSIWEIVYWIIGFVIEYSGVMVLCAHYHCNK